MTNPSLTNGGGAARSHVCHIELVAAPHAASTIGIWSLVIGHSAEEG
jgi:hypothetical protein